MQSILCSWHCSCRSSNFCGFHLAIYYCKHMSMASLAILSNCFEEQWIKNHPQYLLGLSSAVYLTTFLEIAIFTCRSKAFTWGHSLHEARNNIWLFDLWPLVLRLQLFYNKAYYSSVTCYKTVSPHSGRLKTEHNIFLKVDSWEKQFASISP